MTRRLRDLHGFIGQHNAVIRLVSQIHGAQACGEPCPHILLHGPSGVGKTKLAKSIAKEAGANLLKIFGTCTPEHLKDASTQLQAGDFLFIDEAHRLGEGPQEFLCEVIDQIKDSAFDPETNGEPDGFVDVKPWTLILATDQPGVFLDALHNRLPIIEKLEFYTEEEMRAIIDRVAASKNLLFKAQAANQLAKVCCGLPRRAIHVLDNLRRQYSDATDRELTLPDVRKFLKKYGIDAIGLNGTERSYLEHLHTNGTTSLHSLALVLGCDTTYVRRRIEPILMRQDLIKIGSSGRQLSGKGHEFISRFIQTQEDEETYS